MKLVALVFRLGLIILPSLSQSAWADDTLWSKTLAHAKAAKQLVPGDIDMVVTQGLDPLHPLHFRSHLAGWEKGNPVYTTIEVDPLPGASNTKAKSTANMVSAIVDMAGDLPDPGVKVIRSDGQVLDGKTWTVFQQIDSGVGRKMAAKIWVEAETGCIHQVEVDTYAVMSVDGHMKISYATDPKGRCRLRQIDADINLLFPFKKVKMKLKQTSSNWVERPIPTVP